jgi:hypothetical protein
VLLSRRARLGRCTERAIRAEALRIREALTAVCSSKPLYEEGPDGGYNVWRYARIGVDRFGSIHVRAEVIQEFMPHGGGGPRHRITRDDWSYGLLLEFRDHLSRWGYPTTPILEDGWRTAGWALHL